MNDQALETYTVLLVLDKYDQALVTYTVLLVLEHKWPGIRNVQAYVSTAA